MVHVSPRPCAWLHSKPALGRAQQYSMRLYMCHACVGVHVPVPRLRQYSFLGRACKGTGGTSWPAASGWPCVLPLRVPTRCPDFLHRLLQLCCIRTGSTVCVRLTERACGQQWQQPVNPWAALARAACVAACCCGACAPSHNIRPSHIRGVYLPLEHCSCWRGRARAAAAAM